MQDRNPEPEPSPDRVPLRCSLCQKIIRYVSPPLPDVPVRCDGCRPIVPRRTDLAARAMLALGAATALGCFAMAVVTSGVLP